MDPRIALSRLALMLLGLSILSGCVKIEYARWIKPPPRSNAPPSRPALLIDHQASYIEIASDSARALPSARFERSELLNAIESAWNGGASRDQKRPARVAVFAGIEHAASEAAGKLIHTILGVAYFMGFPHSCGDSEVTLVVQTNNGSAWVGQANAWTCWGLYYPQDHRMTSIAEAISGAMTKLKPVRRLEAAVPRVVEIAAISQSHPNYLLDRVIWAVQPTPRFPAPWGDSESAGRPGELFGKN